MARPERVFLDANVLFSAAIGSRVCRTIISLPNLEVVTSDYCVAEAARNLAAKGFKVAGELAKLMGDVGVVATPPKQHWEQFVSLLPERATSDLPVLSAAVMAKADVLITGNTRDFGQLMESLPSGLPGVLTPRAFLERGPRSAPR